MTTISKILSLVQTSLPKPPKELDAEEKSKRLIFKNSQDAIAALFHSIMLSLEFRLIGFGEEDNLDNNDISYDRDSEGSIVTLPEVWNVQGPNIYTFRYKHRQSSLTFLIKCMKMANKFLVHGMAVEDNKTTTLEITTEDYVYPSIFPFTFEKFESQPLLNVYISESRIDGLIKLYKTNVIDKLIPNLYISKDGVRITPSLTETTRITEPDTSSTNDPLRIPTRRPPIVRPSIFDDSYGFNEPSSIINPLGIGHDDLSPIGYNQIGFGGGIGGGIPNRGGGMYVGPDHPIFGQRGQNRGDEIFGGPQTLPRGSVPPGSRFDPIGPLGSRPLPRPGQPRNGGGRGNYFGDELPPPGYNDMFM